MTVKKRVTIWLEFESEILGKYEILLFKNSDSCDIYLNQPNYPLKFMYGLPLEYTLDKVINTISNNILNYWERE